MQNKDLFRTFIAVVLAIILTCFIGRSTINKLQAQVEYYKELSDSCFWKQYAEKADVYIDAIYDCDCDCIYDVAMETDAYDEYVEYYERVHSKEIK